MAALAVVRENALRRMAQLLDEPGWTFAFDNAKRRAGLCDYQRRRIQLSRLIAEVSTPEQMDQVILHEIAHALSGPSAKHGPRWRRRAASLGYRFERLSSVDVAQASAPIVGVCPRGHVVYRYRWPTGPRSCSTCASHFDPRFVLEWRRRTS